MRLASAALALTMVAAPAAAQSRDEAAIADKLNDPVVQQGVAAAVAALAGIVLDTRVGPLARYVDPDVRASDTLRDLKRRDDPGFEARLHRDTARAVATAGVVAGDVAVMSGELRRTAERLRAAVAPLASLAGSYAASPRDDHDY